jgi:hypothetical protein
VSSSSRTGASSASRRAEQGAQPRVSYGYDLAGHAGVAIAITQPAPAVVRLRPEHGRGVGAIGPARRSSTTAVGTIYELSSATTAKSYDPILAVAYDVRPAVNTYGVSNARLESTATKLKLLTRMAFGFHSPAPLVELAMLKLGALYPPLPRLARPTDASGDATSFRAL